MSRDFEDLQGADPWAVLGVAATAGIEEIRLAYRRLAKQLHPDSPTGDAQRFKAVSLAHEILSDPARAAGYKTRLRPEPVPTPTPPVGVPVEMDEPFVYEDPYHWDAGPGPGRQATPLRPLSPEPTWTEPRTTYHHHQPEPAWNTLAIVALVMTFGCFPMSLFVAFAALSQIRITGERGAGLAWAAIWLPAATLVVFCGVYAVNGETSSIG